MGGEGYPRRCQVVEEALDPANVERVVLLEADNVEWTDQLAAGHGAERERQFAFVRRRTVEQMALGLRLRLAQCRHHLLMLRYVAGFLDRGAQLVDCPGESRQRCM